MYQLLREHPMAFDVEERMSWRGRLHLEHAFDDKAIRRAEEKSILRATTRDLLPELISERSRAPIPRPRVQPTSRRCVMPWPPSRPIATRRWRPSTVAVSSRPWPSRSAVSHPCMSAWWSTWLNEYDVSLEL